MYRILIVDDEPEFEFLLQQWYRDDVQSGRIAFRYVKDGKAGWEVLQNDDAIDVVLLDINMPEISGLDVLGMLPELHRPTQKAIIVSAYDEIDNVRRAMNLGAFDFIVKPIRFQDFDRTLGKTLHTVDKLRLAEQHRGELETARRAREEQQIDFSRRLLEQIETERKRIAGELHDSLGQNIVVLKNRALLGRQAPDVTGCRTHFDEIAELASATLDEVRRIAHNLRPYHLDRFGLTTALTTMMESIGQSTALALRLSIADIDNLLSGEAEIHVYRIVQELTANILKHSGASLLECSVARGDASIELGIRDDGSGMPTDPHGIHNLADPGGLGMLGIAERVRLLNGTLEIGSSPGHGTRVTMVIPLDSRPDETQH